MKKHYFLVLNLALLGLIGCSRPHPKVEQPASNVTVRNDSDAHEVEVYWTASGCGGVDMQRGAADVCHQESISARKSATYTFAKNTSDRAILLYRPKDYCALVGNSDLSDLRVAGDEVLRTDGCVLEQDKTENSMLANPKSQ